MILTSTDSAPRVSVVLPAYNAERTIGEALASVFAQTFRDFEVIVVDDGSTDGTRAVLDRWRTAITCVRQLNGGPGRARNAAIRRARGQLVAFLDADDVWLPDKLARQVEYFDEFPATGLLHTAALLAPHAERGRVGVQRAAALSADCSAPLSPPSHLFCEIFETRVEIRTLTVMVPRLVLDEAGGFDERREMHVEDWELWLRIAARHPVGYLRCPLATHRDGGVMSASPDKTFAGQMLVIEQTLPEYVKRCEALNRPADRRARTPRHRAAWELAQARFERDEFAEARRALRAALLSRPWDVKAHVYHAVSHLPPAAIERLRSAKRRRLPAQGDGLRLAAGAPGIRAPHATRSHLVQDTAYRRARRRIADRLHEVDKLVDGFRARRRRVLFEAASPLSFAIFKPLYRRLRLDPRIEFHFTSTSRSWPADAIFGSVGIFDRVIPPARAAWMKFDTCVNTDFFEMTWLHRCATRLHLFHGVAGKYGIDAPVHVAPDIAAFDALLFPNRDRLDRYVDVGLVHPPAAYLVGFPKVDSLVDGSLDREAIAAALGLRRNVPTVLYAPTWSPESSLHSMGDAVVRRLVDTGFNVLVKLHDRSYDLTHRASGGIDWTSRLAPYANHERIRIIRDPDATPYLAAADALVTDHSSIGFEYALLDRPIVVIDAPRLHDRARINPKKVEMLRSAAEVIECEEDLQDAIVAQLANPLAHAADRRRLADRTFFRPGTATDRAISVVYDAIGLTPWPASVARHQAGPVEEPASRRVS